MRIHIWCCGRDSALITCCGGAQLVSCDFATVAGILQETAVSLVEAIQSRFGVESGDAIRSSRDMGALLAPDDVAFAGDQSCILGTADYLHLHSLVEQADEVRVLFSSFSVG